MRFLFLFMDGVGLGIDDPASNPLAKTDMPNLIGVLVFTGLTAITILATVFRVEFFRG